MVKINLKKVVFVFFITLLISNNLLAHKQRVHQYLVREAYKLLKLYLGNHDVPRLLDNLGTTHTGGYLGSLPSFDNGHPWVDGKIVAGAFREDEEDVVYGYGDFLGDASRYAMASLTHFWRADLGDNQYSYMNLLPDAPQYFQMTGNYPNAYQKLIAYAFPNSSNAGIHRYMARVRLPGKAMNVAELVVTYNSLPDLFKNRNIYIRSASYLDGTAYFNPPLKLKQDYFYDPSEYNRMINILTWEILGRMAHLIGDMSIPAHVHNDSHVSGDPYEDAIGVTNNDEFCTRNSMTTYWNANRVWNTFRYSMFDEIMNPYFSDPDTPMHYLMYTLNQLTDHFASKHLDGNDIYDISNPQVVYYNRTGILPKTAAQYQNLTQADFERIRDATFPHAIRAIAGLLYWFAKEADLLPTPLTYAYVSGTYELYQGGTGNWYVQLGNGLSPFTYQWEIMYLDGAGFLQNYESVKKEKEKREKEKKKDGDIIIAALPSNSWVPIGTNSSTFSKPHNPYDLRDYKLRCTVTDGSNTTKVSNEWRVDVIDTPPPQGSIVADSNNDIISLAKYSEEISIPTDYALNQNYPNPFNPTTRISYSMPYANFVTLKIYDMLGSEVAVLVNENKPAGKHEVEFDASKLSSGTYVYKLVAGNYQLTKKMQLVK